MTTDQEPYLIISSDCHAGLPTEEYRPYLEARFHRDFDEFLAGRERRREEMTRLGIRNDAFATKWFQDNEEGLRGGWDTAQRLKELDGDGVAAEVVFPDADAVDSRTAAPFGVGLGLSGDHDPELGMAGAQAHNRWLADFVSQNPERHCGVALLPITADQNWNCERRVAELEKDGIVAEVLFPNTIPPFFPSGSLMAPAPTAEEFERRWAGLRAHNRWLADFCAAAPGRRAGVCQILLNDVEEAVKEIRWASEAGLRGGLMLPGTPPGSGLPELYSQAYDPIWAVCEELGVPVNHHAGSASPPLGDEPAARAVFMVETTWFSHRALWHLVFGGAFRRHPGLKLVLTEQGSGWIPGVLDMLDYYHGRLIAAATNVSTAESKFGAGLAARMGKPPSEVWHDNCFVGASFMRPHEVPLRDRIGVDKIMWGSDYPHDEGTYPYSREGLRFAYAGVPRDELAAMLGGNAARVYGFDLDLLAPIAAKVGPTVEELAEPLEKPPADATSPVFAKGASVRVW